MIWRKIFFLLLCPAFTDAFTQSIDPVVLASCGDHYSNSSGMISFTAGESAVQFYTSVSGQLTEGFHQPDIGPLAVPEVSPEGWSVYPNPFSDKIIVKGPHDAPATVRVASAPGIVMVERDIQQGAGITELDLNNLATGVYILTIESPSQFLIRKLIKL